jgi:hypothetical protein
MSNFSTIGYSDADGDHPPSVASKPTTSSEPTVTRNEEGKPTLRFGSIAAEVPAQALSNDPPTTSHPVDFGQHPQPIHTLSVPDPNTSTPSTMATSFIDTDIIHQVHNPESNSITVTVRGGRYDTSKPDPVTEASAQVMKGRKISKPKGKSSARLTETSAVTASVDSMANATQTTGSGPPAVLPPAQPTPLATSSSAPEPPRPTATASVVGTMAPVRPSKLTSLMKEQQHEPSKIDSILDEINQPIVTTYSPHADTSPSPPKLQHQPPRIGPLRDEINQPTITYTPHPLTSQSPAEQENKISSESVFSSANSNIPLFHPSMFPNPNKHFTATQNPASLGSYGDLSKSSTERSVAPYSPSTAMRTNRTKDEDLFDRYVRSQMKPYPVPSGAFGNPRPGASFSTYTHETIQPATTIFKPEYNIASAAHAPSPLFGQAFQPTSSYTPPSAPLCPKSCVTALPIPIGDLRLIYPFLPYLIRLVPFKIRRTRMKENCCQLLTLFR